MDADACGRVGWLMRCLQTRMSVNKKEKYILTWWWMQMRCVRPCWHDLPVWMRCNACRCGWRADGPVKKNKTKRRKEKKTYLILDVDGSGCGW